MKNIVSKFSLILILILSCPSLFWGQNDLNGTLVKIIKKVQPSIVHLRVKRNLENKETSDKSEKDQPESREVEGVGSGVIVSEKGYILTNYHVIANAEEIIVTMDNNEVYDAETIGTDGYSDLAVLKIDAKLSPDYVAQLGNSDQLKVGEIVLAMGSPFGLRKSVTQGIISGKGRKSPFGVNYIQTDAAINPGNSGGGLINLKGEIIGINSAIFASKNSSAESASFQGVGLAIPINIAKKVLQQIIKYGKVKRGFLGIEPANYNNYISKQLKIKNGVMTQNIVPKSPAEKAGLKPWDIITHINGKKVKDFDHIREIVAVTKIGGEIEITYIRNKKTAKTKAVLVDFDQFFNFPEDKKKNNSKSNIDHNDPSIGLKLKKLSSQEIQFLKNNFLVEHGVMIIEIKPNSIGSNSDLQVGDVILEIEGTPIKDSNTFESVVKQYKKSKFMKVRVFKPREGRLVILPIKL